MAIDLGADFGAAATVSITVLVDNRADLIIEPTENTKVFTKTPLLAEHGFSALVDLDDGDTRVLWDAGFTAIALPENLKRMHIDPVSIDMIALSHGHSDHTGAVSEVLREMRLHSAPREWPANAPASRMAEYAGGGRVQVVAHPAAFRERWRQKEDGGWQGPDPAPPRTAWEALGAQVVLDNQPHRLAPGCWTTGSVPRISFESSGIPKRRYYRDGETFHPDYVEDDQAIVVNVRGKGLVVLTGCAHSGVVNTINYAQEISGLSQVYAVIGGYHLARAASDEVERTMAEFARIRPQLIAPTHCTGFTATRRFSMEFADAFDLCTVGKTYLV